MEKNIYKNVYLNNEISNAIEGAKALIDKAIYEDSTSLFDGDFEGYQQTYFATNEEISNYLNTVDISKKESAITVTASGDHPFNLVNKGILNIDTFDVNKLTEYIAFGLKLAMIIKFNYYEYINIITILSRRNSSLEVISSIIYDLLPYMDEKYRIFWEEVVDYNYKIQKEISVNKNLLHILAMGNINIKSVIFNNNYLASEEAYNKLRNSIAKANLTFTSTDALNLAETFQGKKYDLMLLSNILDYFYKKWGYGWNYNELIKYTKELEQIMNKDGIIFLFYMFAYEYKYPNGVYKKVDTMINSSCVYFDKFTDEEIYPLYNPYNEDRAGIILKRC